VRIFFVFELASLEKNEFYNFSWEEIVFSTANCQKMLLPFLIEKNQYFCRFYRV
jgi:hypothetical protein